MGGLVTRANGNPAEKDIMPFKSLTGKITTGLRSYVPCLAENYAFTSKGKKYTS